ncbi:LOW QUALITY PROTEIN: ovochymase-1 [Callospermophilus lateralis]
MHRNQVAREWNDHEEHLQGQGPWQVQPIGGMVGHKEQQSPHSSLCFPSLRGERMRSPASMGTLARAGLLLLLAIGLCQSLGEQDPWTQTPGPRVLGGDHFTTPSSSTSQCCGYSWEESGSGIRAADWKSEEPTVESRFFSRISWRNSTVGGRPWQVSLKLGERHICGGSLIEDDRVVTAAHCLSSLDGKQLKNLTVMAGEYNLFQKEKQEQNIPVLKIVIHPEFNRLGYMSFDIALLYLKHKVKFGIAVQPICLLQRDDRFEARILCMASGWGKITENSEYSDVLQEGELSIMDDRMCNSVLKSMNLPPLGRTLLCAGFPEQGKDACQGDTGGPLACRRPGGVWTLAGITSWVAGCERGLASQKNYHARALPGFFSKVFELMDFITQNLITDCKPQGIVLFGESGEIQYPYSKEENYSHNSLCVWKIMVPEDKIILIKFTSLDIENRAGCDHDYISLQSSDGAIISKVCGDMLPSPLLMETNQAIVTFVSDAENSGSGFELCFTAIQNSGTGSGCESVAVLVEEGTIQSANYPLLPNNVYYWFIHAPEKHIIKLTFEDFKVEFNQNCIYDSIVIYDDPEEKTIFSFGNMMVMYFKSDGENNFQGFKVRNTFLPSESLNKNGLTTLLKTNTIFTGKAIPYDICGIPPFGPQWLSRRIAGGEEACPHCWPWQVGLRFLGDHQCGGAIIDPVWILTAAHCVQSKGNPRSWTVVAGDHDRTLKESTEQVRRAKHIIVHEDFDIVTYDSDIALIQLSSPLEYNSVVRPVCLPHSMEPLFSSEICTVTGWGSTSEDGGLASRLQQIQVPVLERAVCERVYYSAHPGGITDRMICAGSAVSGRKDFCQGDSGGPLVCRHENSPFVLYGIVSWGAGCIQPWKPGVFARVRVFLDWIQSKIRVLLHFKQKIKAKP